MAIIALEGMRFLAHHGVLEVERRDGNHFEVDVWVDCGSAALPDSDELEDTYDYGKISRVAAEVMRVPRNLLETLVNEMGRRLMSEFPEVRSIRVRVSKENPIVDAPCRRSFVEAEFHPSQV
ncbi:MAG: hypothetical protein RLZZ165_1337 [Bacteroidota bacterium]|jgi:dihydroneopterin aldolase